jgi:hypothetical protein
MRELQITSEVKGEARGIYTVRKPQLNGSWNYRPVFCGTIALFFIIFGK